MKREELYAKTPQILRNILVRALPSVVVYYLLWYKAGLMNLWGYWLGFLFKGLRWLMPIHYEPTAFFGTIRLPGGRISEIGWNGNQLNITIAIIITLFAILPHPNPKKALRFVGWILVVLTCWQLFEIWFQLYHLSISDDFANRQKIFWEPSVYFSVIHWFANFDTMILRYWMGFGVFGMALLLNNIVGKKLD
ncbi:MAG: hypothetical protein H6510_11030 [Acidobacteria bacterium]|nr:hypothetical protein [Acidobacteriota bacterium]MCB9398339.1 hypothetical protein [Acidobacteriota bacterium]